MNKEFKAPKRVLMGPGPSNVDTRVMEALSQPILSHLDPAFQDEVMDAIQDGLQMVFEAENSLTLPISGTGTAGMEAALINMIEPGDSVLICTAGFFAERMAEIAERAGGQVTRLKKEWGEVFEADEIRSAIDKYKPSVLGFCLLYTSPSPRDRG